MEPVELPKWEIARLQVLKILETGTTESVGMQGRPVVLMTIRGARSGKFRYVPIMRVESGGSYAVVASAAGAARNPAWYGNLLAHPEITLLDGRKAGQFWARELADQERDKWWDLAVAAFPPYEDYQRNAERRIPVLVLEPV